MYKMWFNTGVRPENRDNLDTMPHQEWRNGTLQIAYYLEYKPPAGAVLQFLCQKNYPLPDYQIAIKIVDGGMFSDFAVFNKP